MELAIRSVQEQDYEDLEHLIVIDGAERESQAREILERVEFKKRTHVLCLPYITGKKFNGHRIYGASCFLANGDYIAFLDQDNWWEANHISLLAELIYEKKLDWAHSLRKIVSESGEFLTYDNCENLGKWLAYTNNYYHVDTSCYLLRRELAVTYSPIWFRYGPMYRQPGQLPPDMALANSLVQASSNFQTTGAYSVNYRLGSSPRSVKLEFFLQGNEVMTGRYPDGFPWYRNVEEIDYSKLISEELPINKLNLIAFPNWREEEEKIFNMLDRLIGSLMEYSSGSQLTLFLWTPEKYQTQAGELFFSALMQNVDLEDPSELRSEVYFLGELSPCRRQALQKVLTAQVTLPFQDTSQLQRWLQPNCTAIPLDALSIELKKF